MGNLEGSGCLSKSESSKKPVNCDEAMNVTNITDLQSYAQGTVVEVP